MLGFGFFHYEVNCPKSKVHCQNYSKIVLKNKSNIKLSVLSKVVGLLAALLLFVNIGKAQSQDKAQGTKDKKQIVADTLPIKKTGTFPSTLGNQTKDKTLKKDTVTTRAKNDSLLVGVPLSKDSLDSKVDYDAKDSIVFDYAHNFIYLYGNAIVKYKTINLTANFIVIDFKNNIASAGPTLDSAGKKIGLPHFKEGQQDFTADSMRYNFKTRKGLVFDVVTKQNDVYIHGAITKFTASVKDSAQNQVTDDIAYSSGAIFTTCNAPHPHFGIYSNKQKVIANKMVIVGLSQLYISDVPTPLFLPFAFFPLTKGKRTGLIFPRDYEYSPTFGYGLREMGWYFPLSDNYDLTATGDVYWKGTFGLKLRSSYVKKYTYSGGFTLGYRSTITEDAYANSNRIPSWSIQWNHSKDSRVNPTLSFSASVNMSGSTSASQYANYNSTTYNDFAHATTTSLNSSISFTKTFPGKPYSLSGSFQHSQNTITRDFTVTAPDLNFSLQTIFPFKRKKLVGEERWYEKISFQYNTKLTNRIQTKDSLLFTPQMWNSAQFGMSHTMSSNVNFQIGNFQFSPSINYSELWYLKDQTRKFDPSVITKPRVVYDTISALRIDSTVVNDTIQSGKVDTFFNNRFSRVGQLSAGANLSTKIFGTINFKKGWLRGIRHRVDPNIGFVYSPDYRNYADSVQTNLNNPLKQIYSRYENSIFGTPSSGGPQAAITYSLSNFFELKYLSKDSTLKKMKLLENIFIGGSFNAIADSFKWSRVAMSTNTSLFKGLSSLSVNALFDPYGRNKDGRRLQTFAYQANGKLLNFENLTLSINTGLSIRQIRELFNNPTVLPGSQPQSLTTRQQDSIARRSALKRAAAESFLDIFNNFSLRHTFAVSIDKQFGHDTTIVQNALYTSGDIPITKNWRITVGNIGYDFANKRLTYPDFGFFRSLHCWEMGMNWQPTRNTYSFFLRVRPGSLDFLKLPYNKSNGTYY